MFCYNELCADLRNENQILFDIYREYLISERACVYSRITEQ